MDEPSTIIVFPTSVMFSSAITAEENVNIINMLKKTKNIFFIHSTSKLIITIDMYVVSYYKKYTILKIIGYGIKKERKNTLKRVF